MYIVLFTADGEEALYHGPFEGYDEANDYVLLSAEEDDLGGSEIIELTKPQGLVIPLSQGVV